MAAIVPPQGQVPPQDYVHLTGDAVVEEGISQSDTLRQILHWIGFRTDALKDALTEDAFESFGVLKVLTEKDITAMSSDFASKTQANGRFYFGTLRTKRLKVLTHWIQDFYRVSSEPSIVGLSEVLFKSELERALARHEIRKSLRNLTKTATEVASPGSLEHEKKWKEWEEKFVNYAGIHLGVERGTFILCY